MTLAADDEKIDQPRNAALALGYLTSTRPTDRAKPLLPHVMREFKMSERGALYAIGIADLRRWELAMEKWDASEAARRTPVRIEAERLFSGEGSSA